MGLYLGIGADTAAAQTVGPFTVDFLYPNLTTDQNLGTYNFPSQGQFVSVPFGVGVETTSGPAVTNIFELEVTPTLFGIRYFDPTNPNNGINFVNGEIGIIKVTTTESRLINSVSLLQENGITLNPGAFLFGSNFFQVNLADASFINPRSTLIFSASYSESAEPVPEPEPLPPLALGLVALALIHRTIRTNGRKMA